jgi:mediator of RNA polymerase II transcription subunit 14
VWISATGYAVEPVEDTHEALQRKRKLLLGDKDDTPLPRAKKAKSATGFVPEVYYVVAFCDDQLAHMLLAQQLRRENVVCSGPELEDRTSIMKLFRLPECVDIGRKANALLANNLLSCSIRLNSGITSNIWQCEMKFAASPLAAWTASNSNHLPLQVELSRDKAVGDLLAQWTAIARLYEPVLKFATLYANAPATLQQSIRVSSYTFDTLTFAYGPNGGCFTMTVQYKVDEKSFQLTPASLWSSPNPHSITLRQLEHELNRTQCLFTIAQLLADTWSPLLALSRLVQLPLNASTTARQQVVLTFALTPLTASHVRLMFRHLYALDVHVQNGQCVTVRDGAYSFDHSRLVDFPLAPIQGLKGFLALYADSNSSITSVARRRSINDDQQPASPAVMDMLDSLITPYHQTGVPKPAGGPIPSPAYDPSSPSTSQKAASSASLQQYPSPIGAGFPLASPPGIHAPSPSAPSPSTQSSVGAHVPSSPSNFASMASPAAPMSVGSQGQLRASAPRSWTVPSFPTVLSQDAFYRLLTSSAAVGVAAPEPAVGSPLERFLGSALLRRHLQRFFQSDESHHFKRFSQGDLSSTNNAAMKFGTESLQCEVALSLDHQSLHLSLQPAEHSAWDPADLDVLQKFFATQVTCPPYQTNALTSFCRLLAMPHVLLRDCVRLMRLEMTNDATLRWRLRWCLTIPHGMAPQLPIGSAAVICKEKFFFVMQLTRQDQQFGGGVASGPDSQVLLLPITYHMKSGMIQAPEKTTSMQIALTVNTILKRALQVQSQYVSNPADISLFEVIRFLLQNLEL